MSKPSFSNIDLWLFEYAEGNLTPDQEAQLELFILQHPELDVDRDMWEMAKVGKTNTPYPESESLYRRKPVGMYVGVGAMGLLLLLFTGYALMQSPSNEQEEPIAGQGYTVKHNASHVATEKQLREEIADLKLLVASLEGELRDSRGEFVSSTDVSGDQNGQNNTGQTINDASNLTPVAVDHSSQYVATHSVGVSGTPATATTMNLPSHNGILTPHLSVSNGNPNMQLTSAQAFAGNSTEAFGPDGQAMQSLSASEELGTTSDLTLAKTLEPASSEEMKLSEEQFAAETQTVEKVRTSSYNTISSNYNYSYKYRLAKWGRELQRMMDNPIALKNYRDPFYHVPGATTTDLNFGATGTVIAPRVQTLSRLQWYGQPNQLLTNEIALDGYAYSLRGGVGMQMTHQYYANGGIQNSSVAFTYSPKISINRKISLEPAVRFKMGNKTLEASRMEGQTAVEMMKGNVIDYYADGQAPVGRFLWYKDLGLGMNINTEWFYVSAQVDNMFHHRDNIYSSELDDKRRAGTHFVATIGTDWESKKSSWETKKGNFGLSPYLVYQKYEDISELWAGANFRAHWLSVGAAISSNLDPAASLGFVGPKKHFSLLYNIDYMKSTMTGERSLSHQLTLRFVGKPNRAGRRLLNQ